MVEVTNAVTWEAPEHHHVEKGSDWFWVLGLIAGGGAIAALVLGNVLFSIVVLLGAIIMALFALNDPRVIPFAVTARGVRIGTMIHTYNTLESYCIDEEHERGPQLLVKSARMFMPLLILPLPKEHVDSVEDLIAARLPEEELEEPLSNRVLEFFGF